MSGFILKEIETDKITMVRGEEKLIVAMNDPQKAKARGAAAVTTAAAPAAQPKTTQAAPPAQRQREARRAASGSQAPSAVPQVSTPQATLPQPTTTPVNPSSPGRGIKGAPQGLGDTSSQVDTLNNRAPGAMIRR
jgi:hypothetical protein